jgi:hypothetical protein
MKIFTLLLSLMPVLSFSQNLQLLDSIYYAGVNNVSGLEKDSSGNVYIAGSFEPASHDHISKAGVYIKKYDPSGTILWSDTSNFSWNGSCVGIVTEKNGNSYIAGTFPGINRSIKFGSYDLVNSTNTGSYFVKYGPAGNVLWAKLVQNIVLKNITADANGNLFAVGNANNTTVGSFLVNNGFIIEFDSSGNCVNAASNFTLFRCRFSAFIYFKVRYKWHFSPGRYIIGHVVGKTHAL